MKETRAHVTKRRAQPRTDLCTLYTGLMVFRPQRLMSCSDIPSLILPVRSVSWSLSLRLPPASVLSCSPQPRASTPTLNASPSRRVMPNSRRFARPHYWNTTTTTAGQEWNKRTKYTHGSKFSATRTAFILPTLNGKRSFENKPKTNDFERFLFGFEIYRGHRE